MRQSYSNIEAIADSDKFYGISLGYDFCAEHEWGIKNLLAKLNVDNKKMGISGRQITKHDCVHLVNNKDYCCLTSRGQDYDFLRQFGNSSYKKTPIISAWDESDFCVFSDDETIKGYLQELYVAFQKNDIIIARLRGGIFANSSLSILIASRVPKEQCDQMYIADKAQEDLINYENKIGVTKLKEEARSVGYKKNHYFLACSPKWIDYNDAENREKIKEKIKTKYDIQFWINYSDDDDNYGWYIAEEIIKWLSTPGLKLTQIRNAKIKV